MQKIRIAGCRLPVGLNIQNNLKEIKTAIDWAAENSVDIISTPECALSGYLWKPNHIKDPLIAEIEDAYTEICEYSKEKNVDIVLGTGWVNSQKHWCNAQKFIVDGKCIHTHQKVILFPLEAEMYTPGGDTVVTIRYKGLTIAGLICNDAWSNPFAFQNRSGAILQSLRDKKTDIIFLSANVPGDSWPRRLFYDWNKSWIEMAAATLKMSFVVSDVTVLNKPNDPISPAGVCEFPNLWKVVADDTNRDYFFHDIEIFNK